MKAAIERSFLVNVLCGALCVFGLFTLVNMKRDLIPPLSWPYIRVAANLPGASTEEVERLVTFPIEEALRSVPNVKNINSDTWAGSVVIWLEFGAEHLEKLDNLQNTVRDSIARISHRLPLDLRPVNVTVDKVTEVYLATYAMENYDSKNPAHRATLLKARGQLGQIPGVASVNLDQDDRNLFVRIQPEKLERFEISIPQIRAALARYLSFEPLGQMRWNGQRFGVQMQAQDLSIEAVRDIPLTSNKTGNLIRIADVANVEWDSWEKQQRWLWNGKSVAELEVRKDLTSDSIALHEKVKERVREIGATLPEPLKLVEAFDGPRFIRKQIEVLSFNGWFGFVLVVIILGLFLGYRSALMAAWGLPISYLGTFIALSWFGISIDLLSILGLILVVGILVDDAIIVTDRYNELLSTGLHSKDAAYVAAKELIVPVTGTIVTTIVAFLPIMTIPSNMTWFLQAIPLVVIVSLVVSWAECFWVLPNHLAHFVKRPEEPVADKAMKRLQVYFERALRLVFRFRWIFSAIVAAVCVGTFYLAGTKMQHHFNISIGSEQIVIYADLKESRSLDETVEKMKPVLDYVATLDRDVVEYSTAQIGSYRRDGETKEGFRFARVILGINGENPRPVELRKKLQPEVAAALKKLETDDFELLTSEERKRGEEDYNKNTLSVHISGQDESLFQKLEVAVAEAGSKVPNIKFKSGEDTRLMDIWTFEPAMEKISQYGLSRSEVSAQIREHISAYEVGQARVGGESVSLLTQVKYPEQIRFEALATIPVLSPLGEKIPISWLGQWGQARVPEKVPHRKGVRYSEVKFKFDDAHYNVETAKAALDAVLPEIRAAYPAFDIGVENANKRDEENKKWITKVAFYSLVGVAVVLVALLGSFAQPFLVMLPVPLGIVGALLMLYLHGMPLTMMAVVGLLGVIGVAVNDSIVLTHHFNRLRKVTSHLSVQELVIASAKSRLRAILLTSLTTLGGLFPSAYGLFGESGFTQPIAFTMAWGLFFSTIATLFVLPLMLWMVGSISTNKAVTAATRLVRRRSVRPTAPSPAP